MLQSVPDPFDSYGPPQAEDQIFSILAPLSIMTTLSSSSPSPMTGNSELENIDSMSSDKIISWLPKPNSEGIFPSESAEWAGVPSPTSTPPRSVSPPILSRRHSTPPSAAHRKSESKLRSVLSIIDETCTQHTEHTDASSHQPLNMSGKATQPDTGQHDRSFTYGQSPYDNMLEEDPTTPRHSLFFSQSTALPPDPITEPPNEPDEPASVQPTLTPIVS